MNSAVERRSELLILPSEQVMKFEFELNIFNE